MINFEVNDLKGLWKPREDSYGEDNGQVTIIGGSHLFHGAPIFSLKAASRLTDMVFFSSPEKSEGKIALKIKSSINAFIWVPWEEVDEYIVKSEAALVGPGFMRFRSERLKGEERSNSCDEECQKTTQITKRLLIEHPNTKWVIDGGSLQVMQPEWIPVGAVLTPNKWEFEKLFGCTFSVEVLEETARKYKCVIVYKSPIVYVSNGDKTYAVKGGNSGLTKGGTGDVLAGIIVGLLAKNEAILAAAAGAMLIKKTAERLYEKVGLGFNSDDVSEGIFETKKQLIGY